MSLPPGSCALPTPLLVEQVSNLHAKTSLKSKHEDTICLGSFHDKRKEAWVGNGEGT